MSSCVGPTSLVHSAFFYRSDSEYVDGLLPFILTGLRKGEPLLVAVPGKNLALLRDALGEIPPMVTMADMAEVGRNPEQMLGMEGAWLAKHPGRPVRVIGEVMWPERNDEEYPGCVKHEALVNTTFADHDLLGVCPYNERALPQVALADAHTTHPVFWRDGGTHRSAEYAPDKALTRYNQPLPHHELAVTYIVRELADLSPARSFATRYALGLGLSPDGIANLQLIATELATNSLRHGGGVCRLAFWKHRGHVVCEASDSGRLDDPLAGRRLPPAGVAGGRGLFLINAIADLVRTHATPSGTTIQAYIRLGAPHRGVT